MDESCHGDNDSDLGDDDSDLDEQFTDLFLTVRHEPCANDARSTPPKPFGRTPQSTTRRRTRARTALLSSVRKGSRF